jgi:hypothetical protein
VPETAEQTTRTDWALTGASDYLSSRRLDRARCIAFVAGAEENARRSSTWRLDGSNGLFRSRDAQTELSAIMEDATLGCMAARLAIDRRGAI